MKTFKYFVAPLFVVAMLGSAVLAAHDSISLTTFVAGSPAVAAEVNDNFNALMTAIEALWDDTSGEDGQSGVHELNQRVAALEGSGSGGAIQWVDATGAPVNLVSLNPGINAPGGFAQVMDENGNIWSQPMSGGLPVAAFSAQGLFSYWESADCTGTAYYTTGLARYVYTDSNAPEFQYIVIDDDAVSTNISYNSWKTNHGASCSGTTGNADLYAETFISVVAQPVAPLFTPPLHPELL